MGIGFVKALSVSTLQRRMINLKTHRRFGDINKKSARKCPCTSEVAETRLERVTSRL